MSAHGRIEVAFNVVVAENGAIGAHGKVPWHLPNDLKRFKALSMGKPVIMGRRTFTDDVKRPLPGRVNIVVTRDDAFRAEGVIIAHSIEAALAIAASESQRSGQSEIHVIGGGEVFHAAMPFATIIYLTELHARPEADTFMPPFDPAEWRETFRERHEGDERHAYPYSFVILQRIGAARAFG